MLSLLQIGSIKINFLINNLISDSLTGRNMHFTCILYILAVGATNRLRLMWAIRRENYSTECKVDNSGNDGYKVALACFVLSFGICCCSDLLPAYRSLSAWPAILKTNWKYPDVDVNTNEDWAQTQTCKKRGTRRKSPTCAYVCCFLIQF